MSIIPQNQKVLNNRIMTSLKPKRNFSDQKNKKFGIVAKLPYSFQY